MRIRSRLLLLVSAVLLPALVVAGFGLHYVYREERALNRASLQEAARALSLALDRDMARREAALRALAAAPNLAEGNLPRFYLHASAVAKDNDAAIILSDLEGRQVLNTRRPLGARLAPMLPDERENRARYGNEATIISDV